ncbi:hypothetical protein MKS88_002171 [Plasmodium brasilianum]|uniref:Uncharacterized protein n=1 Tax=Plasmodium brasilianum TaxID=5824 RepID=A0ACB9YDU0_PLABR|nr:hypothetical protein MKS88_002171 [Plasmodium brasilianum]
MDSCFSSNVPIFGNDAWRFRTKPEFKKIITHVQEKTNSLKNEKNKQIFRRVCLELAEYLIMKKKEPPPFERQDKWELALKHWLQQYYKGQNKYGICPMILKEENKQILQLIHEAEDFCEEKRIKKPEEQCLRNSLANPNNCDSNCSSKIIDYNTWITDRKNYFTNNKEHIYQKCKKKNLILPFPNNSCDVSKPETFQKLADCKPFVPFMQHETVQTREEHTKEQQDLNEFHEKPLQESMKQTESLSRDQFQQTPDPQQVEITLSEPPSIKNNIGGEKVVQEKTSLLGINSEFPSTETVIEPISSGTTFEGTKTSRIVQTPASPPEESKDVFTASILPTSPETPGRFKKKKKMKRRQVHFLRILLSSFSKKKSEFLSHNYVEHLTCYDKEIVKNIKILEHNLSKDLNMSKQKDRSKTIIEVHMEVLEKSKNEEWESRKVEFLEICLQELLEEQYGTSTNLTNDKIMENTKNNNDMENQKILWHKWIERYRNLSEKLKKEEWFTNLKNEWKTEQDYIKKSENLKTILSNKNRKIRFIEWQKDIWRHWISKKGIIIKQHLEHDWLNGLTKEFLNITDEYKNESLINMEELKHKGSYEEIYKYIRKNLLAKLCILVLIMVLEESTKEEDIENRESYLDNFINEWNSKENSDKKPEIAERIIEYKGNDLENNRNKKIHDHIEKNSYRTDIGNWIRDDIAYENSINNDGTVDESVKTS